MAVREKAKEREFFIVILCVFLAFALRFYTFDKKSLWLDEIYTFSDSRDGLWGQIKFYKENPNYLHPPLFFIMTHSIYPFTKPERDLRIIPLIFGILSIPMIYLLSRQFSPNIAIPCTLSLTFMTYHISLSQDGRSYSMLMFIGMTGLYFLMKHLQTLKKRYLILVGLFFAILFYTSYSSILFIALSQILLFYQTGQNNKKFFFPSLFVLNSILILLIVPWVLFLAVHYKGQAMMDPLQAKASITFWSILYGILHDWVPFAPLMTVSVILLILFPLFSQKRKNTIILLAVLILPTGGLLLFCKLLNIQHFLTSRYFINFLPLFFISLYLSIDALEFRFGKLKRLFRMQLLFIVLLIASNVVILPLYYKSEKQNLRDLVSYLNGQLKDGDKIFLGGISFFPAVFHYFGIYPEGRHYRLATWKDSEKGFEFIMMPISDRLRTFFVYYSRSCCTQYIADGSRLWIVVGGKQAAKEIQRSSPSVLKGYFDGSVLNYIRFPMDASIYLFLWDPKSPEEKGIDMPIE